MKSVSAMSSFTEVPLGSGSAATTESGSASSGIYTILIALPKVIIVRER